MRIVYFDIDSLRPDHLGCYGYHRATSPNIDALARDGVRLDSCYVSDAPCLPSRTALFSGRYGVRTGVVGHGGTAADPRPDGRGRGGRDSFGDTAWPEALRRLGYSTATVSSFAWRHGAWHMHAGFEQVFDCGKGGMETADEVAALARPWLIDHGRDPDWFLHVNLWDPHTPYRTPESFGDPFAEEPLPPWLTEEVRARCWAGFGPHSAREPQGWGGERDHELFPRVPEQLDSMDSVRAFIDGYDTGVLYADEHVGSLLQVLDDLGVLEETAVIVGADHGEALGELNVWGDHQFADHITCRVPYVLRWPGMDAGVDDALHVHVDLAATVLELAGADVPPNWDGRSFAASLRAGAAEGRGHLVTGQGAWSCQRGVRFDRYMLLETYHDGFKDVAPHMLFDVFDDPHERMDLAPEREDLVSRGRKLLAAWLDHTGVDEHGDPLQTVLAEEPFYMWGRLGPYVERLRATGREGHAEALLRRHPLGRSAS